MCLWHLGWRVAKSCHVLWIPDRRSQFLTRLLSRNLENASRPGQCRWAGLNRKVGSIQRPSFYCMKHYCIQLDFEAAKMRFLDPDHLVATDLGNAFPLTFNRGHIYLRHAGLLGGTNTNALIDTGWMIDLGRRAFGDGQPGASAMVVEPAKSEGSRQIQNTTTATNMTISLTDPF